MKKINIKYTATSEDQFSKDLYKLISIFASDKGVHLEMNIVLNSLESGKVKQIIDAVTKCKVFKDIHNENIFTFILTITPDTSLIQPIIGMKNLLTRIDLVYSEMTIQGFLRMARKKKMPCNILIQEEKLENLYEAYKSISKYGYPIQAECDVIYDDVYSRLLEAWMYDRNGCRLNVFTDFISRILLDYWGTKCQYKSCITKYFYVDKVHNIYACKKSEIKICNLVDVESLQELYSKTPFVELLKQSIEKRKKCEASCIYFNRCQGGCPLISYQENEKCNDKELFEKMDEFNEQLKMIIVEKDYNEINPALRDIILSSLSSNKLFEKGLV